MCQVTGNNSGFLVETESGRGRTYHSDDRVDGKIKVYLLDHKYKLTGKKILCNPKKVKVVGFIV